MPSALTDHIRQTLEARPAAATLIDEGRVVTAAQLLGLWSAAVRFFAAAGLKKDDHVGLSMPLTPLHLVSLLALAHLGVCSVPVHGRFAPEIRTRLAQRFGLRAMVSADPALALEGLPLVHLDKLSAAPAGLPPSAAAADAPLRVLLTSGTTGDPKGVLLSHGHVLERLRWAAEGWTPEVRLLAADPHLSVGFYWSLFALCSGGALVFTRPRNAPEMTAALRSQAVTHWVLSPWAAQQLLDHLPPDHPPLPSLRCLRLVGAAPAPALIEAISRRLSPQLYAPYALTEMATLTRMSPDELRADPLSAGRLLGNAQAEAVDEQDRPLPPGQRGQLRLRTTTMPTAYYRDEARSRERFREGWFYSGDLGYISATGQLYVEGRVDDVLNIGGHKVVPGFIEQQLEQHPQVLEAAVLLLDGVPGAPLLVAAIVPRGQLEDDLRARYQPKLGPRTPQRFFMLPSLPRNLSGKLQRDELARQLRTLAGA